MSRLFTLLFVVLPIVLPAQQWSVATTAGLNQYVGPDLIYRDAGAYSRFISQFAPIGQLGLEVGYQPTNTPWRYGIGIRQEQLHTSYRGTIFGQVSPRNYPLNPIGRWVSLGFGASADYLAQLADRWTVEAGAQLLYHRYVPDEHSDLLHRNTYETAKIREATIVRYYAQLESGSANSRYFQARASQSIGFAVRTGCFYRAMHTLQIGLRTEFVHDFDTLDYLVINAAPAQRMVSQKRRRTVGVALVVRYVRTAR